MALEFFKKSDVSDLLLIRANRSKKMSAICSKKTYFLYVFPNFSPFSCMPKSESLPSLFAPSLFFKKRFALFFLANPSLPKKK